MTAKTPEQLVSVYGDMVYRLAYAQTRSRHDADDIFQEVFLQTVRKRPVFDSVEQDVYKRQILIRFKGVHGFNQPDRADGQQIVLLRTYGVILFYDMRYQSEIVLDQLFPCLGVPVLLHEMCIRDRSRTSRSQDPRRACAGTDAPFC